AHRPAAVERLLEQRGVAIGAEARQEILEVALLTGAGRGGRAGPFAARAAAPTPRAVAPRGGSRRGRGVGGAPLPRRIAPGARGAAGGDGVALARARRGERTTEAEDRGEGATSQDGGGELHHRPSGWVAHGCSAGRGRTANEGSHGEESLRGRCRL